MHLVLVYGDVEVPLRWDPVLVGRSRTCDIVIEAAEVSRKHAQIEPALGAATLVDLDSPNGVFLNGQRIVRTVKLVAGDVIVIGGEQLTVVAADVRPAGAAGRKSAIAEPISIDEDLTIVGNEAARICATARRILDAGDATGAETVLLVGWNKLSSRAHAIHPALAIVGGRLAMRLAIETGNAWWAREGALMLASVAAQIGIWSIGALTAPWKPLQAAVVTHPLEAPGGAARAQRQSRDQRMMTFPSASMGMSPLSSPM